MVADLVQMILVLFVTIAIIGQAIYDSNGVAEIYRVNYDSGRLNFFKATGDMTVRMDIVSAWIGQLFISLSIYGCQQNYAQRLISLEKMRDATW